MNFINASNNKDLVYKDGFVSTSLQGYIEVSYQDLVDTFGEPTTQTDGYKTDAEWILLFEDGTIATIYNYKDGKNYLGDDGLAVEDITMWHIGGQNKRARKLVLKSVEDRLNAFSMYKSDLFDTTNYKLCLIDVSKTTLEQIEQLSPVGMFPIDDHVQNNVKKEICEYENASNKS